MADAPPKETFQETCQQVYGQEYTNSRFTSWRWITLFEYTILLISTKDKNHVGIFYVFYVSS